MSKYNQLKLKQVKENNIKYNTSKDVEIISPNYSNLKINNEDNQIHSKQHKINIK